MHHSPRIAIRAWIWRAFVQTALIPLILVETVLIAIYLLSNTAIRDAQVGHLRGMALSDLQASAAQETRLVESELEHVARLTAIYAALTRQALSDSSPVSPAQLSLSPDGVRYSPSNEGGAASFYSNTTPAQQQDLYKVTRLATLDPFMRETVQNNPLVASIYFNSWDSYNRIYPWFDTLGQYPHDMRIPEYNFYYQAAPAHNPQRGVAWTDVYLDPAGHGWMLSAIAPVFRGDFLEGVAGLDITVGNLLEHIAHLDVPWDGYAMIVSEQMNIMALPSAGEEDFGLDELTSHSYNEAIRRELFKPEDFNLQKRPDTVALAKAMQERDHGVLSMPLNGRQHLVAWNTIAATQWHLLTVVDEQEVFSQTDELANHYRNIGYLLIAGLVLFYVVFFAFMWGRTRTLSSQLKAPIVGIARMLQSIGQGNWRPPRPRTEIQELEGIIADVQIMGEHLEHNATQLEHAIREAQEASRAKSQFISSMSHELRTPLNAIQGFAQLMQMSPPASGAPDYLEEILLASRHLNQLVGDILDWSSIQSERPRLELRNVDASALMRECAELVRPEVEARGLSLSMELPETAMWVRADSRRLRQMLINLLSNAIKYTPQGGITLHCQALGNRVRMSVADTGIGIPKELQPLVFDPFQRLGQENSSIQGTGIGLSLCKEYAALMDAELGLESQPGSGSRFWIDLHRGQTDEENSPSPACTSRVVHVDLNPSNREVVAATLADAELLQLDGETGLLDILLAHPPTLLLLGTELATQDAHEIVRKVRQHPALTDMPIVLLCPEGRFEELMSLGACALLAVPIDAQELRQLVRDLTRKGNAHAL